MNKTTIITLILVVLVFISAVQAYQLTALKARLESNEFTAKTKSASVQSSGPAVTSKSLENLPKMVGGC